MLRVFGRCDRGQAGRACVPRTGTLLGFERDGAGFALQGVRRHGAIHPTLRSVSKVSSQPDLCFYIIRLVFSV